MVNGNCTMLCKVHMTTKRDAENANGHGAAAHQGKLFRVLRQKPLARLAILVVQILHHHC